MAEVKNISKIVSARILQKRTHIFATEKFFDIMKLAIVGSREFENYDLLCAEVAKIQKTQKIDLIVSGGAKGADTLAKKFAALNHIPLMEFLPDYDRYGRGAPLQRNTLIVKNANWVLAFVTASSKGTWDTLRKAESARKRVIIVKS